MDTFFRDLRFASRVLRREAVYTLTVVFTLAACIAANVAIFAVVEAVLLEPLPYPGADRLAVLYNSYPGAGVERGSNGTVDFFQRRANVPAFEEVALYQRVGATVGEVGDPQRVPTLRVTPSLFPMLRVEAARGRTFLEEEMEEGAELSVVLSDAEWRERFGADPGVVGRTLRVDGRPRTIVGVLPAGFRMAGEEDARIFLPVTFDARDRDIEQWHSNNYPMLARLRDDATLEEARSQIEALNASLVDRWPAPGARQILEDAGFHTVVVDAREDLVRDVRSVLYLLWAGVAFVLLVGCVNVTNLALARSHVRMDELATRLSLGAERAALARQLLTESLLVGAAGGVLGLGLGALGVRLIGVFGGGSLPRGTEIHAGLPVALFGLALALVAGLLTGALPAVHAFRADLQSVFRTGSRGGTASRRTVLVRSGLVSGQVAMAFLLLSGAGLLGASFRAALDVDPGFEPRDVVTAHLSLPGARYPDGAAHRRFVDELLPRIRAVPGVQEAGITSQLPFTGSNSSSVFFPEGYAPQPGESLLSPYTTWVSPGYFEAMGIDVLEGRAFLPSDREDRSRVVVIDAWLAHRFWPNSSAVGRSVLWGVAPGQEEIAEGDRATVIGVVETVKQNDLTASEHVGAYYFPYAQDPAASFLSLAVKARPGAGGTVTPRLRDAVAAIDPELPLFSVQTLGARIGDSLATRRTAMLLLGVFALVALLLAVVGLYGSLAYTVAQRTREMGIRMAVGSSPEGIFGLVLRHGLRIVGVGLVVGVAAAFLMSGLLESILFEVRPGDPALMAAASALLVGVATVACVVPAWRATRLDPTRALQGP